MIFYFYQIILQYLRVYHNTDDCFLKKKNKKHSGFHFVRCQAGTKIKVLYISFVCELNQLSRVRKCITILYYGEILKYIRLLYYIKDSTKQRRIKQHWGVADRAHRIGQAVTAASRREKLVWVLPAVSNHFSLFLQVFFFSLSLSLCIS